MIGAWFNARGPRRLSLRERAGVTLIELLIVIMIMLMITAVAIPVVAPAMQNRDVREAARLVDSYINGARTRALQAGHPFGVMLEREPGNPNAVTTLSYVEQPDNYSGDYQGSKIRLLGNGGFGVWAGGAIYPAEPVFKLGDIGWPGNVAPGDIMTIQGVDYRIYAGEPFIDLNSDGICNQGSEPFQDVDGDTFWTPPNQSFIDQATGYFNQPPNPAQVGAITYMYLDPVLAAQTMNSVGGTGLAPFSLTTPMSVDAVSPGPPPTPILNSCKDFPFSITRRPVKTSAPSIQLSGEAVIDLGANYYDVQYGTIVPIPGSGLEVTLAQQNATGYWSSFRANPMLDPTMPSAFSQAANNPNMSDQTSIMITFAPNGMIDKIYSWSEANNYNGAGAVNWSDWQGRYPVSTVYLLVGRRDLLNGDPALIANIAAGTPPRKPIYNVQDVNALWIAINPRNGQVATTENIGFDVNQAIPTNASQAPGGQQMQTYWAANVYYARRLAREQLDMTGR